MFAAQAVHLRGESGVDQQLGTAGAHLQALVRATVPPLNEDRETGPDAQALHNKLWSAAAQGEIRCLFDGAGPTLG